MNTQEDNRDFDRTALPEITHFYCTVCSEINEGFLRNHWTELKMQDGFGNGSSYASYKYQPQLLEMKFNIFWLNLNFHFGNMKFLFFAYR